MTTKGLGHQHHTGGSQVAGLRSWGHSAMTLTFLVVLAKWTPQDLQLGSEPVGEGKELYPGLE